MEPLSTPYMPSFYWPSLSLRRFCFSVWELVVIVSLLLQICPWNHLEASSPSLFLSDDFCLITKLFFQVKHGLGVEEIVNHVMNSWEQATGNSWIKLLITYLELGLCYEAYVSVCCCCTQKTVREISVLEHVRLITLWFYHVL